MSTLLVRDTFDGTYVGQNITDLYSHAPNIGSAWEYHPAYVGNPVARLASGFGRMRNAGTATGVYCYTMRTVPGSPDYEVEAVFELVTALNNGTAIIGRADPVANTMYILRRELATIELLRLVAGVSTSLGSAAVTWTGSHTVTLRMVGSTITCLFDGGNAFAPVVDGSPILAVGRGGVRSAGIAGLSDTAGMQIANFEIHDLSTPPALAPTVVGRKRRPRSANRAAITQSVLPGVVNNRFRHVSVPFNQDSLCTVAGVQYAVWPDETLKPIIGKRTLPDGAWSTFDLSTVGGNPLASPQKEDEHNSCVVGVSTDGRIHVAGNQHDVGMQYVRSTNPGDITAWTAPGMIGSNELSMGYPAFVRLNDGTLLFGYRDGVAGNGDLIINRYNAGNQTWTRIAGNVLLDGNGVDGSPYWNRIAVAPDGTMHVFYTWRNPSGGANDNGGICHMKSLDGGTTWRDMAGNVLALPVTRASSAYVLTTAASGSGILNQNGADVDSNGHPHAAFFLYDGSGFTQINHVWHDGTTWHVDQVTNLTYRLNLNVGIFDPVVGRPSIACDRQGRTFVIYRTQQDGRRGRLNALDVTNGAGPLTERVLWNADIGYHEPTFDSCALKDRDELHMLLAPCAPSDVSNADYTRANYAAGVGRVVTVPMAAILGLPS